LNLAFKESLDLQQCLLNPLQGREEPVENADKDEKPDQKEYGIRVGGWHLA
jgi:hypothetical protein